MAAISQIRQCVCEGNAYVSLQGNGPLRNCLEREPLRYCKGDGNVTFTSLDVGQGDLLMNMQIIRKVSER